MNNLKPKIVFLVADDSHFLCRHAGSRWNALSERNANVVPPEDPEAPCVALERLASDENLRATFGAESRRIVESDMSQEQVAKDTVRLYQDVMNDGHRAGHLDS
jgi:glycosyltransferase involved in cell wall biosynthesis